MTEKQKNYSCAHGYPRAGECPTCISDCDDLEEWTNKQLFNISAINASAERFASRQLIFTKESRFNRLFMHSFSRLGYVQYGPYTIDDYCDLCNNKGCYACNGTGKVRYYFNSEPNEPNAIGMMDRMVND